MSDKKQPIEDETCLFLRTLADEIEKVGIQKSKILNILISRVDDSKGGHKDFEAVIYTKTKSGRAPTGGRGIKHNDVCSWDWI